MPLILAIDRDGRTDCRERARRAALPLQEAGASLKQVVDRPDVSLTIVEWPLRKGSATHAHVRDDAVVVVDGYLLDAAQTPQTVLEDYRRLGPQALDTLDGAFVVTIVEPTDRRAIVCTDRAGSRVIFASMDDAGLLVAPELKCFQHDATRGEVSPAAILSTAANCYQFDDLTYWSGVRAVGPASRITYDGIIARIDRYWVPPYGKGATPRRFDEAVTQAVAGHLRQFERPVLALSGGVDSRLILAAARRENLTIPTVTWSYSRVDSEGSDFDIGTRLAQRSGSPNRRMHLSADTLRDEAEGIVEASDGLVGHLGAFADRRRLAEELAADHDAILFGDECYRGEKAVRSASAAVEGLGIAMPDSLALRAVARSLLRRDVHNDVLNDYRQHIDSMIASAGTHASPQDLHDRLYWQVRLPRLLTGPKSLWRRYLEACSPLLAAPLIEIAASLPPEERVEKRFLRSELARLAPEWNDIPTAEESSRVKWRRVLREKGPLQRFIIETLLDGHPVFDTWFDRTAIERALARALSAKSGGIFGAAFRAVRSFGRPALPPPVILGLLTVRLWLARFAAAQPASTPSTAALAH